MTGISRRDFVTGAAACGALLRAGAAWGSPLGLPLGLQLYSVREFLPKDYDGMLRQLGAMGYREVEAAGFFGHAAADVKRAMTQAGLRCVSAHYSLQQLQSPDEIVAFARELGMEYIVCSSPLLRDPAKAKGLSWVAGLEMMSADDWKWNADELNRIGARVRAAGMELGYHNHFIEFHEHDGFLPYDELLQRMLLESCSFHAGQACILHSRMLLPDAIHDEVVDRLVAMARAVKVGDPTDPDVQMGPLISAAQCERVQAHVDRALNETETDVRVP